MQATSNYKEKESKGLTPAPTYTHSQPNTIEIRDKIRGVCEAELHP